jgi:hypothetical protein
MLWLAAFALPLATFIVTNDHYDRISRSRQVARYGELPFRDFFDPGYFMTVLASAGLQRLLGDNLLGEMLLNASFIATGTVVVFLLVTRVSSSVGGAVFAALLASLALPRLYDFDKFLFYPLGVLLCWRYIERATPARLIVLGLGLVAAALFRYDSGVYIGLSAVVTLVALHAGDWRLLARRSLLLCTAVVCAALPFLLFVQFSAGLTNAADQIVTYARREGARTRISSTPRLSIGRLVAFDSSEAPANEVQIRWAPSVDDAQRADLTGRHALEDEQVKGDPENRTWAYRLADTSTGNIQRLIADPRVEDTHGIDRGRASLPPPPVSTRVQRAVPLLRIRVLPGSWTKDNAAAFLYVLLFAVPVLGVLGVATVARHDRQELARICSLAAMCLALDVFILRDPVDARVGGIAGPAAVMGAWLVVRAWRTGLVLLRVPALLLVCVTVWSVSATADWHIHLRGDNLRLAHVRRNLRTMGSTPPRLNTMPNEKLSGLVAYVRECTTPADRVYASWFLPELYFYAQRGFAAGMVVTFGGHWSEPRYESRMLQTFAAQSVPIVIINTHLYSEFRDYYRAFDRHLQLHYRIAGETDFEHRDVGPRGYRVLVRKDRAPTGSHAPSALPCFR